MWTQALTLARTRNWGAKLFKRCSGHSKASMGGNARKMGIENSDVCLLAGPITEAIQENRAGG